MMQKRVAKTIEPIIGGIRHAGWGLVYTEEEGGKYHLLSFQTEAEADARTKEYLDTGYIVLNADTPQMRHVIRPSDIISKVQFKASTLVLWEDENNLPSEAK